MNVPEELNCALALRCHCRFAASVTLKTGPELAAPVNRTMTSFDFKVLTVAWHVLTPYWIWENPSRTGGGAPEGALLVELIVEFVLLVELVVDGAAAKFTAAYVVVVVRVRIMKIIRKLVLTVSLIVLESSIRRHPSTAGPTSL